MWRAQLDQQGFVIFRGLLSDAEVRHALAVIESRTGAESPLGTGGTRDVLDRFPELRRLAEHDAIRRIVGEVLGTESFVVRATLFDKTTGSNWKVPWHQDLTIAVNRRRDLPGYGPWSTKVGVTHVQPPTEVLERMISLRLHLDPCSESNGALKVIPGTHKLGRVNQNEISRYSTKIGARYVSLKKVTRS